MATGPDNVPSGNRGDHEPGEGEQPCLHCRAQSGRRPVAGMAAIDEHHDALPDPGSFATEKQTVAVGHAGQFVRPAARPGTTGLVAALDRHRHMRTVDPELHLMGEH